MNQIVIEGQAARIGIALQRWPAFHGVLDGLGRTTASGDTALSGQQPGVHGGQGRDGTLFAHCQTLRRRLARRFLLDGLQLGDAAQCLFSHRAAAGGVHVDEIAADVGQTCTLDWPAVSSSPRNRRPSDDHASPAGRRARAHRRLVW